MIKDYIGIPYINKGRKTEGCDCFGLVQLFYKNEFSIDIPEHFYHASDDIESAEIALESGKCDWKKVTEPAYGDVIMMRVAGHPVHIGVILDSRRMLHSLKGHASVIELFDCAKWKNRIEGYYQWVN